MGPSLDIGCGNFDNRPNTLSCMTGGLWKDN